VEVFKTREEVERFIAYLLLKADEAWPNWVTIPTKQWTLKTNG
jgi:hypothetical protein